MEKPTEAHIDWNKEVPNWTIDDMEEMIIDSYMEMSQRMYDSWYRRHKV